MSSVYDTSKTDSNKSKEVKKENKSTENTKQEQKNKSAALIEYMPKKSDKSVILSDL